jgi:hypothetical protein
LQKAKFWGYEVRYKKWGEGDALEQPVEWTVNMQYDPAAGRWKIR